MFAIFMLPQPLLAQTNPCYGGGTCANSGQDLGAGYCGGIVLGDINGDDDLEIVLGNDAGQAIQIYTNDPSGTGDPGGTMAIRRHVQ